jgi:lysophospholipase
MSPTIEITPQFSPQFSSADFASGRATMALDEVWQRAQHGNFASVSQCSASITGRKQPQSVASASVPLQLRFSFWPSATATAALVLIPGRIEAGHKYLEFINEAVMAGFQVYVLDHQGQGASERLDAHSQIGDVRQFNDYVADLEHFIHQVIRTKTQLPLLAIAHSMGGGILCRYLQQYPAHGLAGAVFCSPMWGITTQPVPNPIALPLSRLCSQLNQLFSKRSWYVPGQGPYQQRPFLGNDLSQCQERYQWFRTLYQQYPEYQLGGISWRWLKEALSACQQMQQGPTPVLPCLLLQAGADQVVDNQAQSRLWQLFRTSADWSDASAQHLVPDARHELLFETDEIRKQCLAHINQFLKQLAARGHLPGAHPST